jgi:hypothetical protein
MPSLLYRFVWTGAWLAIAGCFVAIFGVIFFATTVPDPIHTFPVADHGKLLYIAPFHYRLLWQLPILGITLTLTGIVMRRWRQR